MTHRNPLVIDPEGLSRFSFDSGEKLGGRRWRWNWFCQTA
jgi:hypothetical protein